jgi:hypothetical protein
MNEMVALRGVDPREILQTAIDKKVPAIMSYLSRGKWHVAKVLLTDLGPDKFRIESAHLEKKPLPINIQVNQPVGISFKYEYGKFVFDTAVVDLEPSLDSANGGRMVLAVPDRVEVVQRRSYFRVDVPHSLKVNVVLWHRSQKRRPEKQTPDTTSRPTIPPVSQIHNYYQGRLVDISAGGAQVVVDAGPVFHDEPKVPESGKASSPDSPDTPSSAQGPTSTSSVEPDFKKGQFIGLRFTPMPYETPLMFNAQIRNILPTADNKSIYLGLQIVGLESSREGRQVLSRIVSVVERYYRMDQSGTEQPVFSGHPVPKAV